MPQVKVWNDNDFIHKEKFRDMDIVIEPKGFVMMERDDAMLFKGQFFPPALDHDGKMTKETRKMIRIERVSPEAVLAEKKAPAHVCVACKYEGANAKDLSEHIESAHKADLIVDEEAEKEIKARGKARAS